MKGVRVRVWVRNQIPAYPRVKVNVEKKKKKKNPLQNCQRLLWRFWGFSWRCEDQVMVRVKWAWPRVYRK